MDEGRERKVLVGAHMLVKLLIISQFHLPAIFVSNSILSSSTPLELRQQISQPRRKPSTGCPNPFLDYNGCRVVVRACQIHFPERCRPMGHDCLANLCVGLRGPANDAGERRCDVLTLAIEAGIGILVARKQILCPRHGSSLLIFGAPQSGRNVHIPHNVKSSALSSKDDVDAIASLRVSLEMERLVDISDPMNQEASSFSFFIWSPAISQNRGMIDKRGEQVWGIWLVVSREVDDAGLWRRIVHVHVVP